MVRRRIREHGGFRRKRFCGRWQLTFATLGSPASGRWGPGTDLWLGRETWAECGVEQDKA